MMRLQHKCPRGRALQSSELYFSNSLLYCSGGGLGRGIGQASWILLTGRTLVRRQEWTTHLWQTLLRQNVHGVVDRNMNIAVFILEGGVEVLIFGVAEVRHLTL